MIQNLRQLTAAALRFVSGTESLLVGLRVRGRFNPVRTARNRCQDARREPTGVNDRESIEYNETEREPRLGA